MPVLQTGDTPRFGVNLGEFTSKNSERHAEELDADESGRRQAPLSQENAILQSHAQRTRGRRSGDGTKNASSLFASQSKYNTSTKPSPRIKNHGPLTQIFLESEEGLYGQVWLQPIFPARCKLGRRADEHLPFMELLALVCVRAVLCVC